MQTAGLCFKEERKGRPLGATHWVHSGEKTLSQQTRLLGNEHRLNRVTRRALT